MDSDLERLEKTVISLALSTTTLSKDVITLTQDIRAGQENVSKLHEAIRLVNTDVEKHSLALYKIELESAREEGRKSAMGDLQTKLREHDEAAREIVGLKKEQLEQGETVAALQSAHDKQRGFLVAVGVVAPILTTLITAYAAKVLGLGS
jgi:chromosome segregation ATPase